LLKTGPRGVVEFARLFAAIKVSLLKQRLSLLDLVRRRPKDRAAIRVGVPGFIGGLVRVGTRVRVLGNAHNREQQKETHYDPREFFHFTLLLD
jgi:hypothetical protein